MKWITRERPVIDRIAGRISLKIQQLDVIIETKTLDDVFVKLKVSVQFKVIKEKVYDAFYADEIGKGFFHGHTYSANPIACSTALACIELLQSDEIQENIIRIIRSHKEFDDRIKSHSKVAETRQLGVIYALDLNIEMERYGDLRNKLFNF